MVRMSVKPVSFAAEQSATSAAQPMRPVFARLSLKYARSNMTQSAVVMDKPIAMSVWQTLMALVPLTPARVRHKRVYHPIGNSRFTSALTC